MCKFGKTESVQFQQILVQHLQCRQWPWLKLHHLNSVLCFTYCNIHPLCFVTYNYACLDTWLFEAIGCMWVGLKVQGETLQLVLPCLEWISKPPLWRDGSLPEMNEDRYNMHILSSRLETCDERHEHKTDYYTARHWPSPTNRLRSNFLSNMSSWMSALLSFLCFGSGLG